MTGFDLDRSAVIAIFISRPIIVIFRLSQFFMSYSPVNAVLLLVGVKIIHNGFFEFTSSLNISRLPAITQLRVLFSACFSFASYAVFYNSSFEIESSSDDVNIKGCSSS